MKDKYSLIERLSRNSILAVFEAATKMLENDYLPAVEPEDDEIMEGLSMADQEDDENWEGMSLFQGFNAFEVDPDDYIQGGDMGIPRNQLLVSSPYQGMLKPMAPYAQLFHFPEEE